MSGLGFTASPHTGCPAAPNSAVSARCSLMREHHLKLQTKGVISDNKTTLLTKKQSPGYSLRSRNVKSPAEQEQHGETT